MSAFDFARSEDKQRNVCAPRANVCDFKGVLAPEKIALQLLQHTQARARYATLALRKVLTTLVLGQDDYVTKQVKPAIFR